ncbi:MAG: hypothetical protein EXS17_04815 [Phycisphaerales bacterium]|nr:hypothetical protein [Phycisphaerales bacterium]
MTNRNLPHEFDLVAQRIRTIRIADVCVVVIRTLVMAVSVCVATDAVVRFPGVLRWIILGLLGTLLVWLFRKRVIAACAPAESRVTLALRIEAETPHASGRLASGVEFASDVSFANNPLATHVRTAADDLAQPSAIKALVNTKRIKRDCLELAVVLLLWFGFLVVAPQLASTGLFRTLTPWVVAEWPARTGIRSTTFATHHPKNTALSLKADLFRGDPQSEPVWVKMRSMVDGQMGAWEQQRLIHQGQTRFERLIESRADQLEFQFLTRDVESELQQITFVQAPTAKSIIASITPPPYATTLQPQTYDLGDGTRNHGRVTVSILQGSQITLEIALSRALTIPTQPDQHTRWIATTFVWESQPTPTTPNPTLTFTQRDESWILTWVADQSRKIAIRLCDEHGVQNTDDITCAFDVAKDLAPEAIVVEPSGDETVLATAQIPVRGEARDDVALTKVTLEVTRAPGWAKQLATAVGVGVATEVTALFDLQVANAQPGDVFVIVTTATDSFRLDGTESALRPATRSTPRHLRVLTRPQFEEETRNTITAIRQGAIRVNDRQRALIERDEADSAQVRPQSEIGERITALSSMMQTLRRRLDKNQVPDDSTRSLIDAAQEISETAHAQSDKARDALQDEPVNHEEARLAQAEVRQELDDLATLLDRDKDAWMAARQLERVAEAIKAAESERSRAGANTLGRTREQLSADEVAALDRAADAAQAAAQAAREAVEELNKRAENVQQDDPVRAMNLRQAAERGEKESLAARMDKAQQATRENRMDEAHNNSAAAQQTIQEMIADLADDEKARTETLRRRLATLAEALEQLVLQSSSAEGLGLDLVAAPAQESIKAAPTVSQEAAKLALNAAGVSDEGRATGPSAQRVVRLIDRGAEAAGRAATALATAPPDITTGHRQLGRATTVFREALDAVLVQEKRNEEQERQQRARELAQSYQKLVDRQEGVLTATQPLVGVSGERRTLVEARRIGVEQESIQHAITAIADESEDVKKSLTFMEATRVAVEASKGVVTDLRAGPPTNATVDMEREVIETLRGLTDALSEASKKEKDPFADEGQSSGAGSGGGDSEREKPLIPPLAELKVLRALQQRVYDRTKGTDLINDKVAQAEALKSLATRQAAIVKIADELRRALEEKMQEKANESAPVILNPPQKGVQSSLLVSSTLGAIQTQSQSQPPAQTPPAPSDEKSLDELLGIAGASEAKKAADESAHTQHETLTRTLTEKEAQDTLEVTINEMKRSATLLDENEGGTAVQRLHEDILARLDALIQSAQQQQSSSSSSSSSSQSSGEQKGESSSPKSGRGQGESAAEAKRRKDAKNRAKEGGEKSAEQAGDAIKQGNQGDRAGELPPGVDAIEGGAIEETDEEWGNLPPRTREVLRQGVREKMSSVYKRWTEAYYRRIAEEAKP